MSHYFDFCFHLQKYKEKMIWQSFLREKESKTGKLPALTTVKDKKKQKPNIFLQKLRILHFL
jgi:hypothetical protein